MSKEREITSELVAELVTAGVLTGHKRSKTHPRMRQHIALNRNEIELLDPESTITTLDAAVKFIAEKLGTDGLLMVVGTTAPAREAIKAFARDLKYPYVVTRWLGGTLTNFKVISDRIRYYVDLRDKKEKGELSKYTKKEQLKFSEEIGKMSVTFDGLLKLTRLPSVLLVVDPKEHMTAIKEAVRLNIPVVAIMDTNDDPKLVTKPIFANDHARDSISWVIAKIKEGLELGKKKTS